MFGGNSIEYVRLSGNILMKTIDHASHKHEPVEEFKKSKPI